MPQHTLGTASVRTLPRKQNKHAHTALEKKRELSHTDVSPSYLLSSPKNKLWPVLFPTAVWLSSSRNVSCLTRIVINCLENSLAITVKSPPKTQLPRTVVYNSVNRSLGPRGFFKIKDLTGNPQAKLSLQGVSIWSAAFWKRKGQLFSPLAAQSAKATSITCWAQILKALHHPRKGRGMLGTAAALPQLGKVRKNSCPISELQLPKLGHSEIKDLSVSQLLSSGLKLAAGGMVLPVRQVAFQPLGHLHFTWRWKPLTRKVWELASKAVWHIFKSKAV